MLRRVLRQLKSSRVQTAQITEYELPRPSLKQKLEPRLMFDGAAVASALDAVDLSDGASEAEQQAVLAALDNNEHAQAMQSVFETLGDGSEHALDSNLQFSEVVIIDANVKDPQVLIEGINRGAAVEFIDSNKDGVQAIADVLAKYQNLEAIHIVSHGDQAQLQLGSTTLNQANLDSYQAMLNQWGNALSDNGDVLFYGCNVAEGEQGQAFVEQLAELTRADIAASNDLSGTEAQGGNWMLEATADNGTPEGVKDGILDSAAYRHMLGATPDNLPVLTASNPDVSFLQNGGAQVIAPDLTISDADGDDVIAGITVTINDYQAGDVLSYTGTLPQDVESTDGNGVITFTGSATASVWQAFLRTMTFHTTSADSTTRTLSFSVNHAHHYEFVTGGFTWQQAKDDVEQRSHLGVQGYLATITSAEENKAIMDLGQPQDVKALMWIGASDAAQEGAWRWMTGPEAGRQFSEGSAALSGHYANWNQYEPNNSRGNEHYGLFRTNAGPNHGTWEDRKIDYSSGRGYIVEYSSFTNVTLDINRAPTVTFIDNIIEMNEDSDPVTVDFTGLDADGDNVTYTVSIDKPALAQVAVLENNESLVITPAENANGNANITVTATDARGASTSATITLTVNALNDAPTSENFTITVLEDGRYTFTASDFSFKDVDSNVALAKIRIVNLPDKGTLRLGDQKIAINQWLTYAEVEQLTYEPIINDAGFDYASFDFTVYDGRVESEVNSVNINVIDTMDWININMVTQPFITATNTFSFKAVDGGVKVTLLEADGEASAGTKTIDLGSADVQLTAYELAVRAYDADSVAEVIAYVARSGQLTDVFIGRIGQDERLTIQQMKALVNKLQGIDKDAATTLAKEFSTRGARDAGTDQVQKAMKALLLDLKIPEAQGRDPSQKLDALKKVLETKQGNQETSKNKLEQLDKEPPLKQSRADTDTAKVMAQRNQILAWFTG